MSSAGCLLRSGAEPGLAHEPGQAFLRTGFVAGTGVQNVDVGAARITVVEVGA